LFESRLDTVLYRSKFCMSIRTARQLISHGAILVNNQKTKNQSYLLKPGDFISVNSKYNVIIEKSIARSNIWPIPPKHLIVNYKTLQLIFSNICNTNMSSSFNFNLNLEKLLVDYSQ
jgi:ribosomal protein S4